MFFFEPTFWMREVCSSTLIYVNFKKVGYTSHPILIYWDVLVCIITIEFQNYLLFYI
uniref:Uncharacterized protein n=1 Tax=viral metagenome TaxID=1070528 RepID=A0A6C0AEH5_9ZZZZ